MSTRPGFEPRLLLACLLLAACGGGGGRSTPGGVETCTPGATVEVGCAAGCGLGTCTGDPVLAVCSSDVAVDACASGTTSLARSDDSTCGSLCPDTTFVCPASGRVTVAHRAYMAGPYTCTYALRERASGLDGGLTTDAGDAAISTVDAAEDTGVVAEDTGVVAPTDACAASVETCNGHDDDCDGASDEGAGAELGCAVGESCSAGACACPADHMCAGRCVDTDSDHGFCGGCDIACGVYESCALGHCEPLPPRPIAPLSTATVTRDRPTLHWQLFAGATDATVEVCADRRCATVEQTFAVTGTSGAPPAALARGVHYWRVRRTGAVATSPVWQLRVTGRSTAADGSFGIAPDFDLDGYDDLLLSRWMTGVGGAAEVVLHRGSASGVSTSGTVLFTIPVDGGVGRPGTLLGDVNGDGYPDVYCNGGILFGGPAGLGSMTPTTAGGTFMRGVGDVNGDGYGDMAHSGAYYGSLGTYVPARVYHGGPTGLSATPSWSHGGAPTVATSCGYEPCLAGLGDVNGDGFADVAFGDFGDPRFIAPSFYVYFGSVTGLGSTPQQIQPRGGTNFGDLLGGVGDVDGDGVPDVSTRGDATVGVLFGRPTGFPTMAPFDRSVTGNHRHLGRPLAFDANGDGIYDMVARQMLAFGAPGDLELFLGGGGTGPGGGLGAWDPSWSGAEALDPTFLDFDGDGDSEMVVTRTDASGNATIAWYLGGPTGYAAAPDGTFAAGSGNPALR